MAGAKSKIDCVVCPFTVIVDTREQHPFSFRDIKADAPHKGIPFIVKTSAKGLSTGDYSIEGLEAEIAIERKGKPDLFNCMGQDRTRFEEQIKRLNEMPFAALVIEANWESIWAGTPNSRLLPKSIHRTVIAWQQRYPRVHWWPCPTRQFAEATTFRILERYWKDRHQ